MTCTGFSDTHSVMERENDGWLRPAILIALGGIAWALIFAVATGYRGRPSGLTTVKLSLAVVAFASACRFMRYVYRLWRAGILTPSLKSAPTSGRAQSTSCRFSSGLLRFPRSSRR